MWYKLRSVILLSGKQEALHRSLWNKFGAPNNTLKSPPLQCNFYCVLVSSCLHSCWPHPDFFSLSLSLSHPRHGHGIFFSTILPLALHSPHRAALPSSSSAVSDRCALLYVLHCDSTILPLFSTTVSPSSPHPIWPSFSYPLFFFFLSHTHSFC